MKKLDWGTNDGLLAIIQEILLFLQQLAEPLQALFDVIAGLFGGGETEA